MKKILLFSLNYYPRFIGGAEVAIKEITDRIDPSDIEFHMVTLRSDTDLPRIERIGNILVHRIGFTKRAPTVADLRTYPLHLNKYLYQLLAAWTALKLNRTHHYNGIWAMMAHSCAIPAGIVKTFYPKLSYLLTLQEGDPLEHIEGLMRPVWPLFRRGFTKADILQPISTFLLRWGERMGFKGKSVLIPNAVDTKRFTHAYTPDEIQEMQKALGKQKHDVLLVTTSRLVNKNGVDDVIRALALLPEHISFLIYGIGPDENALKQLAANLGVSHRARFMGQISHAAMPLMLQACDIFIRPSRSEGMGNSFIEAMATKRPVIATQEGGIADFLFDANRNPDQSTTGWAVDKDRPDHIAQQVQNILAHPTEVARVTENAYQLVLQKYDWERIATDMREKIFRYM